VFGHNFFDDFFYVWCLKKIRRNIVFAIKIGFSFLSFKVPMVTMADKEIIFESWQF